jgi:mannose/fructose/N-acetylgalactosamine-specific phosphotransferase system component IIC
MTEAGLNEVSPDGTGDAARAGDTADQEAVDEKLTNSLAVASVALSAIGFLTLLRLADRKERTPFRALGLFFATTLESTGGTVLGVMAAGRSKEKAPTGKGFVLAAAGTVLGVITTVLTFNWMRTRRRV